METNGAADLSGQTLGERYYVQRPLARGGMATVYLATDRRLQRTVALKVLRPDLSADPEFMSRFMREARATAALSHPNVVAVFDFFAAGQLAYLVLEYVPGHTLRHVLNEHRLTPAQSLAVAAAILDALIAAHDAGIVHRDIKPENLLIGPRGTMKVADFGLARAMDDHEHKTRTGLVIGTAAYVSPEHVAGTGTGTASDIYSTGILLFEMLTGRPPFTGESPFSVAYQHVNSDVPRPSSRVPGLPTELDELVLGATARDPADRFPDAESFLHELRRVQALMPPPEPLPTPAKVSATTVILASAEDPESEPDTDLLLDADDDDLDETGSGDGGWGEGQNETAGPASNPRRRMVLASLLAIGIVAGLTWAFLAGPLQRGTVPNIVGQTVTDAQAQLAALDMRLTVDSSEYSETAPKDTVISQDPAADANAFIRFPVSVVSSLGPERYAVPDVRGQSVEDATKALTDTKLVVSGQTPAYDEEVAAGLVAGTDPAAGTILKPQDPVQLLVSQGPAPRPVPDVTGKSAADAKAALEAAGLVVQSTEEYSEQVGAGAVAGTNPPAGTEVAKGSTVTMVVSKGPPPVQVPNVVDLKRADAVAKLQAAGFQVNVQQGAVVLLDRVVSQDPAGGQTRPKGSTVSIVIL